MEIFTLAFLVTVILVLLSIIIVVGKVVIWMAIIYAAWRIFEHVFLRK